MKRTRLLLALLSGAAVPATAFALVAGCSGSHSSASADSGPELPGDAATALAQLDQATGVKWTLLTNPTAPTHAILFPQSTPPASLTAGADPSSVAMAFFAKYGAIYQMVDPAHELTPESSATGDLAFASFVQTEGAASVYATRLSMAFDAAGHIESITSTFVPGLHGFATTPTLTAAEATAKAQANMATLYPASVLVSLEATPPPELQIYTLGESPTLAYSMMVSYASGPTTSTSNTAHERVVINYIVDANSGAILSATSGLLNQRTGSGFIPTSGAGVGQYGARESFSLIGTPEGTNAGTPYYLQVNTGQPRCVVDVSKVPVDVVHSNNQYSWDVEPPDPGTAVDAYYYIGQAMSWWQARGIDLSTLMNLRPDASVLPWLGIVVREPNDDGEPCENNAYWDGISTIHVCPSAYDGETSASPISTVYAASVDLGVMGHEFQHAVTGKTLKLVTAKSTQSAAINESLSDVFGEFISHDTPPGDANCIIGMKFVPNLGQRNMIDPHQSAGGAQPDNLKDPLYGTDAHLATGVGNKAWSLATFGGQDLTSMLSVSKSQALGWPNSESLYTALILQRGIGPSAMWGDLGRALMAKAKAKSKFGVSSTQLAAVACAWYDVGALNPGDLEAFGVVPAECEPPCSADGGPPPMTDAGDAGKGPVCYISPLECDMVPTQGFSKPPGFPSGNCTEAGAASLPTCPPGLLGCCTIPGEECPVKIWDEQCYYPAFLELLDATSGDLAQLCATGGLPVVSTGPGFWTTKPWNPGDPIPMDAGTRGPPPTCQ